MKFLLAMAFAISAVSVPIAAQKVTQAMGNPVMSQFPLVQVMKLKGDRYAGFAKSCLVVYDNGRYHREFHRQENPGGQPQPRWRPIEVFENVLSDNDLQTLKSIMESEDFTALHGNVGKYQNIWMNIGWSAGGDAIPLGDIDFFVTAVKQPHGAQVFETFEETSPHVPLNHLTQFIALVEKISKDNSGRQEHATANNCSAGEVPSTPSQMESSRQVTVLRTQGPVRILRNGGVQLDIMVYPDGTVGDVKIRNGRDPQQDPQTIDAVKKWTFAPAVLVGIPISKQIQLQVDFHVH